MITIKQSGNFNHTERLLAASKQMQIQNILSRYGSAGVTALSNATPRETGETALSWDYRVEKTQWGWSIVWTNSNVNNGTPIAILIQYGHGTGTGGYVPPNDFINPAMQPIVDQLAEDIWKEVSRL